MPGGALSVLTVFFLGGIFSAVLASLMAPLSNDRELSSSMILLSILFLVGMALNFDSLVNTLETRLSLEKINPISLGHTAFSFAIFFLVVMVMKGRLFLFAAIILPVLAITIAYARSRGAYIAGGTALIAFFFTKVRSRRALIVGAGIVVVVALNPVLINHVIERLLMTNVNVDMSTYLRVIALKGAWQQFLDNPLFGRYVIERVTGYYPHNIYIEALMSVGLVGAIPFFLHVIIAIRSTFGLLLDRNTPVVAVFMSLIFLRELVGSMFSGSLYGNTIFWIASISTIVLWLNRRNAPRMSQVNASQQLAHREI